MANTRSLEGLSPLQPGHWNVPYDPSLLQRKTEEELQDFSMVHRKYTDLRPCAEHRHPGEEASKQQPHHGGSVH